ncbi:VOC family protein [Saccharopolyspora spinosa]|uniref:Glyoxalase/bleomycin resistance protein/dioxygenase superfamily protein n=1 Tax=Saccharopolyspora spinosa TaxID=60894 RepID=A0A2N3XZE7_SACSN|nr:hypothetical protein [Saccharopolyspora spinosa]PKW16044.1 hypothetical protein A8926_3833 [Saccharopolyspora spinosa]
MKANIGAITLGVQDLERSLRFYRDGLGLSSPGIIGTEHIGDHDDPGGAVAMFTLENGLILSLYSRDDLALDADVPLEQVSGSPMSLGYFVDSPEESGRCPRAGAGSRRQRRPRTTGTSVGNLRRLLRRPRRAPVGGGPFPDGRRAELTSPAPG